MPEKGLIAVKVEDLNIEVPLQENVQKANLATVSPGYFRKDHQESALGTITGMIFKLVPEFTDAYIYSSATEKDTKSVTLHYKLGDGAWQKEKDQKYPFEFSMRVDEPQKSLKIKWEADNLDGKSFLSKEFNLVN